MHKLKQFRKHYPWVTLVVLVLIVGITNPIFLLPANLIELTSDISTLWIMAMGMTFVIYIGGIDLSSQSIANMTTVLATVSLPMFGIATALVCLAAGLLFGAITGMVTTRLKVPSFISSLAVGGIALSVGQFASGQRALYMDAELREQAFGWIIGSVGPVPNALIISLVVLAIAWTVEQRMVIGRVLKATGTAELAAEASGVLVHKYRTLAFAISGLFAAIAGLMFSAKLAGGSPTLAEGLLLPAIVAVLVGGTPLTGGVGGVVNTTIGVMIVAVIRTSMLYLDVPATSQQIFFGVVLVIAIALTIDRSKFRIVK